MSIELEIAQQRQRKYRDVIEEYAKRFLEECPQYEGRDWDEICDDVIETEAEFADACWFNFMREPLFDSCGSELEAQAHIITVSENTADDEGLWEGLEPLDAIAAQAYYTFEGDLLFAIQNILLGGD
jgi:hypothetical protein